MIIYTYNCMSRIVIPTWIIDNYIILYMFFLMVRLVFSNKQQHSIT